MMLYPADIHQRHAGGEAEPDVEAGEIAKHGGQVAGGGDQPLQIVLVEHGDVIQGHLADKQHGQDLGDPLQHGAADEVDRLHITAHVGEILGKAGAPFDHATAKDPLGDLVGVVLAGPPVHEMLEHLEEVGSPLGHVDGHHPIRDALGAIREGAEGEGLDKHGQPLLAGGDAGGAGAQPGGIGLLTAVEGGTDVHPALVDLQYLQIELRETGMGVELDVIPPAAASETMPSLSLTCTVPSLK